MASTVQRLSPLHLGVLQNTITTIGNLVCLRSWAMVRLYVRNLISDCWVNVNLFAEECPGWSDTCQRKLLLMIAFFFFFSLSSYTCLSAGTSTPVTPHPINFSRAFTACCRELHLSPQGRQQGTSQDFGYLLYSLHLAPSYSASK